MQTHANKAAETKSQSIENKTSQQGSKGDSASQFVDRRSGIILQRKLQKIAHNSPKIQRLSTIQEMANQHVEKKSNSLQPNTLNEQESRKSKSEASEISPQERGLSASRSPLISPSSSTSTDPIQRMVVTVKTGEPDKDHTLDFGASHMLSRDPFSDKVLDFAELKVGSFPPSMKDQILYLVGHGNVNEIGNYNAEGLALMLYKFGLPFDVQEIQLLACKSGVPNPDHNDLTIADRVRQELIHLFHIDSTAENPKIKEGDYQTGAFDPEYHISVMGLTGSSLMRPGYGFLALLSEEEILMKIRRERSSQQEAKQWGMSQEDYTDFIDQSSKVITKLKEQLQKLPELEEHKKIIHQLSSKLIEAKASNQADAITGLEEQIEEHTWNLINSQDSFLKSVEESKYYAKGKRKIMEEVEQFSKRKMEEKQREELRKASRDSWVDSWEDEESKLPHGEKEEEAITIRWDHSDEEESHDLEEKQKERIVPEKWDDSDEEESLDLGVHQKGRIVPERWDDSDDEGSQDLGEKQKEEVKLN